MSQNWSLYLSQYVNTNEVQELEKAIQYIREQIIENQFQSCRPLREVSDRYLRVLLGRAMTRLSILRQQQLEQNQP